MDKLMGNLTILIILALYNSNNKRNISRGFKKRSRYHRFDSINGNSKEIKNSKRFRLGRFKDDKNSSIKKSKRGHKYRKSRNENNKYPGSNSQRKFTITKKIDRG